MAVWLLGIGSVKKVEFVSVRSDLQVARQSADVVVSMHVPQGHVDVTDPADIDMQRSVPCTQTSSQTLISAAQCQGNAEKCVCVQPVPLPKDADLKAHSLVHLEVEHKPGTKFWPYKELKGWYKVVLTANAKQNCISVLV